MIWTQLEDDVIRQCKHAVENCEHYHTQPSPWFTLCLRMHEELTRAGLLQKTQAEQEICEGCIWYENGCKQHFEGAHVDRAAGKVLFCPRKTTQEMRRVQAERNKKRGRA